MEVLKEFLVGIVLMAICVLLLRLYIGFCQLRDENSKRGEEARFIGKIGSGIFCTYISICSIAGLIIGLIALLT